jgi:hypothetical protein
MIVKYKATEESKLPAHSAENPPYILNQMDKLSNGFIYAEVTGENPALILSEIQAIQMPDAAYAPAVISEKLNYPNMAGKTGFERRAKAE